MVGFGVALLLVAIAAGRVARSWQRLLLLLIELLVGGAIIVGWIAEVWFLAKTGTAFGMTAAPALVLAILCGLVLVAPAVALVRLIVVYGYTLLGRRAQLHSDFRRSVWISRGYTFRPGDF
jgi:hypothetical protein